MAAGMMSSWKYLSDGRWLLLFEGEETAYLEQPCQHEKVYADYVLISSPPQYPWICKLCGVKGIDKQNVLAQIFGKD